MDIKLDTGNKKENPITTAFILKSLKIQCDFVP